MCYGNNQLDVTHTLTTYLLLCYLNTATLAHDTFITDSLVLSAMALIILYRTEYALAEKTVTLGLVCTVVDSLRFQDLTAGVSQYLLG